MKRLLIAAGCLFLSACSMKEEQPHLYVKCWEQWHNTIIYSGWTDGHGIGMGTDKSSKHVPFIVFKDEQGQKVIIVLTDRVCAVAAE
jgi:hypothetical protein